MKIIHEGFDAFRAGAFGNAGANLFVDAKGTVRRIAEQDLNGDGSFDIVFPNSHGYIERGPTTIFTKKPDGWAEKELPHDSCWKTRTLDLDGDGFEDLLIANAENGVTSILTSYVYWGGKDGLTGERAEFRTDGAYDVAAIDLTGNGLKDLVFTSAWYDHHFPGFDYKQKVFVQESPRHFREATDEFNFNCNTIMSIAVADFTGNGYDDLVFIGFLRDGSLDGTGTGYIYHGGPDGLSRTPETFDTHLATSAIAADLYGRGVPELITGGDNRVTVYHNRNGHFSADDTETFVVAGQRTQFFNGRLGLDAADVDGDGVMELVVGSGAGFQIRKATDLQSVWQQVDGFHCSGVRAYDFRGDGKKDILACCYTTPKTYDTDSFLFLNTEDRYSMDHIVRFPTHGCVNVDAADLDHDGQAEIIFCNTMYGPSQFDPAFPVFCYHGTKDGVFSAGSRVEYPVKYGAYSYAAADVDNDGYPELAATSWSDVRLFQGTKDGPDPSAYTEVHEPEDRILGGIIFADLNRNGWLDMIATGKKGYIFWGGPEGYSNDRRTPLPGEWDTAQAMVLADVNGDGYLDLVHGSHFGDLSIIWGTPDGLDTESEPTRIHLKNQNGAELMGVAAADINGDGKLELMATSCGHYTKRRSFLNILFDPDAGYPMEKQVSFETGGTTGYLSLADLRHTGALDLILPFYSTSDSRVLPLRIFRNDGKGNFDFAHPQSIVCESSIASLPVDLDRNGYPDLLICCHRNNLGHMVESLLYHNGPDGLDLEHPQKLLGYGPHDFTRNMLFNMADRTESEYYTSVPMQAEPGVLRLSWDAETPADTALRMRVRFAPDEASLAQAAWSAPVAAGEAVPVPADAACVQYQAEFFAPNACGSPRLHKVEVSISAE